MKKRAQASTEYVLVIAVILLLFVPTTFLFLKNARRTQCDLIESKITRIANEVIISSEEVFYQGVPAKITFDADMPAGVLEIYFLQDWSVSPPINQFIFNYSCERGVEHLVFDSRVNVNGSFSSKSFTEGKKKVILNASRDPMGIPYVDVIIQ